MLTEASEDLKSEQVIAALLEAIKGVLQRHSGKGGLCEERLRAHVRGKGALVGAIGMGRATRD